MAIRLQALARLLQVESPPTRDFLIDHIAPLHVATTNDLSFLPNDSFEPQLMRTTAGAVLVTKDNRSLTNTVTLVVQNPLIAIGRAASWLPCWSRSTGSARHTGDKGSAQVGLIHPSAIIDPTAVVQGGARIGAEALIGANAFVDATAIVGSHCVIQENASVRRGVTLGNRVIVGANSVIGADPFMYVKDRLQWIKIPDFGGVDISDDVELGCGVSIDRGLIENTHLAQGVKVDNQVHIGHGARLGPSTVVAARTTLAGEVVIGGGCTIGGACTVNEGVFITDNVILAGMSAVTRTIRESGSYASVWPIERSSKWWRQIAMLKKLVRE